MPTPIPSRCGRLPSLIDGEDCGKSFSLGSGRVLLTAGGNKFGYPCGGGISEELKELIDPYHPLPPLVAGGGVIGHVGPPLVDHVD